MKNFWAFWPKQQQKKNASESLESGAKNNFNIYLFYAVFLTNFVCQNYFILKIFRKQKRIFCFCCKKLRKRSDIHNEEIYL